MKLKNRIVERSSFRKDPVGGVICQEKVRHFIGPDDIVQNRTHFFRGHHFLGYGRRAGACSKNDRKKKKNAHLFQFLVSIDIGKVKAGENIAGLCFHIRISFAEYPDKLTAFSLETKLDGHGAGIFLTDRIQVV